MLFFFSNINFHLNYKLLHWYVANTLTYKCTFLVYYILFICGDFLIVESVLIVNGPNKIKSSSLLLGLCPFIHYIMLMEGCNSKTITASLCFIVIYLPMQFPYISFNLTKFTIHRHSVSTSHHDMCLYNMMTKPLILLQCYIFIIIHHLMACGSMIWQYYMSTIQYLILYQCTHVSVKLTI